MKNKKKWDVSEGGYKSEEDEIQWVPTTEEPKINVKYTDDDMKYWIELYRTHRTFDKVRKALKKEGKKVPGFSTLKKRMKQLLGLKEYQNLTRLRYNFNDVLKLVKELGTERTGMPGRCLSKPDAFKTVKSRLTFQCGKCNHVWQTTFDTMNNKKSWCIKCASEKRTDSQRGSIGKHIEIIEEKCGKLIDVIYVDAHKRKFNQKTRFKVECLQDGYIFEISAHNLKNGKWCRKCAHRSESTKKRGSIEKAQKIAIDRGGKCLTKPEDYKNQHQKLKFQCGECETIFQRNTSNLIRGDWCPTCNQGKWEKLCRDFFEIMFRMKFPKSYPSWLINSRGNQMELDGLSKKLALAFEYQGEQHYKFVPYFHKSIQDFQQRWKDDILKKKLCKDNEIFLIQVPYWIRLDKLQHFIKKEYERLTKKKLPKMPKINYNKLFNNNNKSQTSLDLF